MSKKVQKIVGDLKKLPDVRKEIDSLSDKKYQRTQKTVNMLYAIDSEQSKTLCDSYEEFDVKRTKRIAELKSFAAKTEKDSFGLVVSLSKKNKNSSAKELLTNIEQYSSKELSDLSLKERINSEIAKSKKKKKITTSISVVTMAIVFLVALFTYIIPESIYRKAQDAFSKKTILKPVSFLKIYQANIKMPRTCFWSLNINMQFN